MAATKYYKLTLKGKEHSKDKIRIFRSHSTAYTVKKVSIAMLLVTSPIVINVPTRGLLAVETMHAIVEWLANLNIKRNMTSMFVNKKHRYIGNYASNSRTG